MFCECVCHEDEVMLHNVACCMGPCQRCKKNVTMESFDDHQRSCSSHSDGKRVFRSLSVFLFVKDLQVGQMSPGGLWLPLSEKDLTHVRFGEVISVGPGRMRKDGTHRSIDIDVGAVIMYPRNFGTVWEGDGDDGRIIRVLDERQVMAVIEDYDESILFQGPVTHLYVNHPRQMI